MTDAPAPLLFAQAPDAPTTFNVLLWGPPKSGKTTAAATANGPILWVNAEGPGALGFARKVAGERGTAIHEVVIDKAARTAAQTLDEVYRHIRSGATPTVETVVIDTIGKVREALIEQLVDEGSKNSLKQYGQVSKKLGGFINALRDLPVNLIVLAHAETLESDEDGRIVQPLIGGKLTALIPGEVDVVAYTAKLKTDDGIRYVGQLVESKGRTGLGDRSGGIAGDESYRDLDLAEWFALYRDALTPKTEPLPFDDDEQPGEEAQQELAA